MLKYEIKVKLKEGIKDIKGDTLMSFVSKNSGIKTTKTGNIYYVVTDDDADIEDFVKEYLVNPQLEDYDIVLTKNVELNNNGYTYYT